MNSSKAGNVELEGLFLSSKNLCRLMSVTNMEFLAWWVLKSKVFAQKSTIVKWNCCILWIDIEWSLQKLGLIFESKVAQKLSLEKSVSNKNCLLNWYSYMKFFFEKIRLIWHVGKVQFWHFLRPWPYVNLVNLQNTVISFEFQLAKTWLSRTHQARNFMT